MSGENLHQNIIGEFNARYTELGDSVRSLAAPLSEEQFWRKPFDFGNSFGHLVLHLTGNLNYYIGAEIGNTGYVRDRPREFTETRPISKEDAVKGFDEALATVIRVLESQSATDWEKPYTALGEESASNRFTIFLRCATHLHHHIGQMHYLCAEIANQSK
jgi:uncharacterized damage-inducible protein DinB